MRLKRGIQLIGVAYGVYLSWWLTHGWPKIECCPCCGWENESEDCA